MGEVRSDLSGLAVGFFRIHLHGRDWYARSLGQVNNLGMLIGLSIGGVKHGGPERRIVLLRLLRDDGGIVHRVIGGRDEGVLFVLVRTCYDAAVV